MTVMRGMMSKLKLTVNETKTRLCRLPEETFDFLGYTLGRNYDCRTGKSYLGPRPSRKKIVRLCREISELTDAKDDWAGGRGANWVGSTASCGAGPTTFASGPSARPTGAIDSHVRHRVRQWLCAKFKVQGQGRTRFPDAYLYQELGLYRLQRT